MQLFRFSDRTPFIGFLAWEVGMNAAGALVVTAPLWLRPFLPRRAAAALVCGVLIDLDHTARGLFSFERSKLPYGKMRPPTHSLGFAALIALLVGLITRRRDNAVVLAWIPFAALASHLVRDASGDLCPIVWPARVRSIPWSLYPLGIVVLLAGSLAIRVRRNVA